MTWKPHEEMWWAVKFPSVKGKPKFARTTDGSLHLRKTKKEHKELQRCLVEHEFVKVTVREAVR